MLGKGLEALIPPQSEEVNSDNNQLNQQINPQGVEQDTPAIEPGYKIEQETLPEPAPIQTPQPEPTLIQSPQSEPQVNELPQADINQEVVSVEDPITQTEPEHESPKPEYPEEKISGTVFQIEIDRVKPNPHQPRKHFEESALSELAISIREFGVLQPLVVSKVEEESERGWSVHYELIAGERRLMASKIAGLRTVPVIVRKEPADREKLELAIIENIQREDLDPIELAKATARLQDEFGLTQREIATRLGKSRESIANNVRLLSLPTHIQEAVSERHLSESHARLLLSIDDLAVQDQIFKDILREGLNIREATERIKRIKSGGFVRGDKSEKRAYINPEVSSMKEKLEEFLGTKVDLQSKGSSGKITISFYSPEELEGIVDKVIGPLLSDSE